jgi:hypothetical protein
MGNCLHRRACCIALPRSIALLAPLAASGLIRLPIKLAKLAHQVPETSLTPGTRNFQSFKNFLEGPTHTFELETGLNVFIFDFFQGR